MLRTKKKPPEKIAENRENLQKRNDFFNNVWRKRRHFCQSCSKYLGGEPLSYMFDHLIEKSKNKELEFVEENIYLCCLECHDNKTRGFPSENHKKSIETIKTKYNL